MAEKVADYTNMVIHLDDRSYSDGLRRYLWGEAFDVLLLPQCEDVVLYAGLRYD